MTSSSSSRSNKQSKFHRPSRRLLVGLTFLLLSSNPADYSTYQRYDSQSLISTSTSAVIERQEHEVTWLQADDDVCLGIHGFGPCSILNAWNVHHHWGSDENLFSRDRFTLESFVYEDYIFNSNKHGGETLVLPGPSKSMLSKGSYHIWNYDSQLGRLSTDIFDPVQMGMESLCVDENRLNQAIIRPCGENFNNYIRLALVPFPKKFLKQLSENSVFFTSSQTQTRLITDGYMKCPSTGLLMPRTLALDPLTSEEAQHPQVHALMGFGLYTKVVFGIEFKVFNVGWYVDADHINKDPIFEKFDGKKSSELKNPEFYDAMIAPSKYYDRSVMIKLAMTLQCDMMINSLVDELDMLPRNKELLVNASKNYEPKDCEKGLELFLTWRHARHPQDEDFFEIRVENKLIASVYEPSLARDLFRYFVCEEPISITGKAAFVDNFPLVLNVNYQSNQQIESNPLDKYNTRQMYNPRRRMTLTQLIADKTLKVLHVLNKVVKKVRKSLIPTKDIPKSSIISYGHGRIRVSIEIDPITTQPWILTPSGFIGSIYNICSNLLLSLSNKVYGRLYERVNLLHRFYSSYSREGNVARHGTGTSRQRTQQAILNIKIEIFLSAILMCYFVLLIVVSLPPAMLSKGKRTLIRAVRLAKHKSMESVRRVIQSTRSLVNMVRNRSAESLDNIFGNSSVGMDIE